MKKISSLIRDYLRNKLIKKEGGPAFSNTLREYTAKKMNIKVGYGTYGGCFNLKNNIPSGVEFGNYCSVAQNIRIFRANHPKSNFTSHPILYNPIMGCVEKDKLERPKLKIGHDVWIGEWVIILPNVKEIGNGVIIGAGSIVTKDIPAYTIVAGNPARIIGKRFSENVITKLEQTQWWNWDKYTLIKNKSYLEAIVNEK